MEYPQKESKEKSGLLTAAELEELEGRHPDGLSCAQIVELFEGRGIKLSEATFRKYVQLGLLPQSRRVGQKGKHKGSKGIYPVGTLRQINEIKRMMALDFTIEDIQRQFAFVGGELEELERLLERIMEKLERSMSARGGSDLSAAGAKKQIEEARRSAKQLVDQLEEAARLIRDHARIARDAV